MQSDTNTSGSDMGAGAASGAAGSARATDASLEEQVARLRQDMAGIAESLRTLANERAENARHQAFALRDEVRDRGERYVRQAQDAMAEAESQISERVRAEPIKSVLIAAAIGYFYARIFKN